ncbi:MAG: hypothetical protein Q9199_007147 [Rusavskia elegans]
MRLNTLPFLITLTSLVPGTIGRAHGPMGAIIQGSVFQSFRSSILHFGDRTADAKLVRSPALAKFRKRLLKTWRRNNEAQKLAAPTRYLTTMASTPTAKTPWAPPPAVPTRPLQPMGPVEHGSLLSTASRLLSSRRPLLLPQELQR